MLLLDQPRARSRRGQEGQSVQPLRGMRVATAIDVENDPQMQHSEMSIILRSERREHWSRLNFGVGKSYGARSGNALRVCFFFVDYLLV